jgi:hypothetical protein
MKKKRKGEKKNQQGQKLRICLPPPNVGMQIKQE